MFTERRPFERVEYSLAHLANAMRVRSAILEYDGNDSFASVSRMKGSHTITVNDVAYNVSYGLIDNSVGANVDCYESVNIDANGTPMLHVDRREKPLQWRFSVGNDLPRDDLAKLLTAINHAVAKLPTSR